MTERRSSRLGDGSELREEIERQRLSRHLKRYVPLQPRINLVEFCELAQAAGVEWRRAEMLWHFLVSSDRSWLPPKAIKRTRCKSPGAFTCLQADLMELGSGHQVTEEVKPRPIRPGQWHSRVEVDALLAVDADRLRGYQSGQADFIKIQAHLKRVRERERSIASGELPTPADAAPLCDCGRLMVPSGLQLYACEGCGSAGVAIYA